MDNNDFDSLNFDDTSDDWFQDGGQDDGGQQNDQYSGFDDDDGFNDSVNRAANFDQDSSNLSEPQSKSDTIKAAALIVVLGIILCVQALLIWRVLSKDQTKDSVQSDNTTQNYDYSQGQQLDSNVSINNNSEQGQQQSGNQPSIGTSGQDNYTIAGQGSIGGSGQTTTDKWKEFSGNQQSIVFNQNYQTAKFQITKVEHFVCIQESDTDYIQVKTTLTGQIQGYPGVYQIDIPYSLGANLQVNQEPFDVQILVGTYEGRTVIGDIRYY